jgi:hypothetical protein
LFVDVNKPKGNDNTWGTEDDGLIIKENKIKGKYCDIEIDILQRYRNKDNPNVGAYEYLPKEANTPAFGRMYDGEFIEINEITIIDKIMHPKEVYWYSKSKFAVVFRAYVENNEYTRKKSQIEITFNSLENGKVLVGGIKMQMYKVGEENGLLIFQSFSMDYLRGKPLIFVDTPQWHGWKNNWAYIVQIKIPFEFRIDVDGEQFKD